MKRLLEVLKKAEGAITPSGYLCILVGVLSPIFAILLGWTFFASFALVGVVLIVCAVPYMLGSRDFDIRFEIDYDHVIVGSQVRAKVVVKNVGRSVSMSSILEIPIISDQAQYDSSVGIGNVVRLRIPILRASGEYSTEFELPTKTRAVFSVGPASVVRTDLMRLFRVQKIFDNKLKLFIHPRTVLIPSTQLGTIRDIDGDPTDVVTMNDLSFHDIREYRYGDPVKNINWKATAKNPNGDLMVRQFEESRTSKIVFTLSTNTEDYAEAEELELAISALASLGARAAYDKREIAVVTSQSPLEQSTDFKLDIEVNNDISPREVLDSFSAVVATSRDLRLVEVMKRIAQNVSDASLVVLGVGSAVEFEQINRAINELPSGVQVVVVIANPYVPPFLRQIGNVTYFGMAVLDDLRGFASKEVFD